MLLWVAFSRVFPAQEKGRRRSLLGEKDMARVEEGGFLDAESLGALQVYLDKASLPSLGSRTVDGWMER